MPGECDKPALPVFVLVVGEGACNQSHRHKNKQPKHDASVVAFKVIPLGLEPRTPTLKVLCSTC